MKRPSRIRRWLVGAIMLAALVLASALLCDRYVDHIAARVVKTDIASLEPAPVGLVLGTRRKVGELDNQFYFARIAAARKLYASGKVRGLIVSGDNRRRDYNEPAMMKADLVAAGVPAEHITEDFAGFRTLDSVVRAKEVFGQSRIIVVSQEFHAKRAVFIAEQYGIGAQGFVAAEPAWAWQLRIRIREIFARLAACVDLWLLHRQPHFLGKPEPVGLKPS